MLCRAVPKQRGDLIKIKLTRQKKIRKGYEMLEGYNNGHEMGNAKQKKTKYGGMSTAKMGKITSPPR